MKTQATGQQSNGDKNQEVSNSEQSKRDKNKVVKPVTNAESAAARLEEEEDAEKNDLRDAMNNDGI